MAADFVLENHGSVLLLDQVSDAAQTWIADHIDLDDKEHTFFAGKLVVEPRYAAAILEGIATDGLTVEVRQ